METDIEILQNGVNESVNNIGSAIKTLARDSSCLSNSLLLN